MQKVFKVIQCPTKLSELNLDKLTTLCKMVVKIEEGEHLQDALHDEIEPERSEEIAQLLSDYLEFPKDDLKSIAVISLKQIEGNIASILNEIIKGIEEGKSTNRFFINKRRFSEPRNGFAKLQFFFREDVSQYPTIAFTKAMEIVKIIGTNPFRGTPFIADLIGFLAVMQPRDHKLNAIFTKDIHGKIVYDTQTLEQKKALFKSLNAVVAIRLFNFFLTNPTVLQVRLKAYSLPQQTANESQV